MKLIDTRTGIEVITTDECMQLLGTKQVGRLAFLSGGLPQIVPVNYVLDGGAVVFATGSGSKLWGATRSAVAFEVDHVDETVRAGWSVVVHGLAQEITDLDRPDLVSRVRGLPLRPWAGGDRPNLIRLAATTVTGRRVGTASTLGVQR